MRRPSVYRRIVMADAALTPAGLARRPRRPAWATRRTLRLASGLVLFAYVTSHLVNHALGNVSLDAMEAALDWIAWFWRLPGIGQLLYGAMAAHALLGVYAIYERPRAGWRIGETAQLALGLALVPLLVRHVADTRLAYAFYGQKVGYAQVLYFFRVLSPVGGAMQAVALVAAWLHGCLGLYYWLRLKRGFERAAPWLLVAATLLPVVSLLGYAQGAGEVARLAADESWLIENVPAKHAPVPGRRDPEAVLDLASLGILVSAAALVVLAVAARIGRRLLARRGHVVRISYPDGAVARVPRGTSVLEASRTSGIPHASVCGGRGRCSTCRVRVLRGGAGVPEPAEQAVLDRIGGGDDVRLACQLRPDRDLAVVPLLSPRTGAADLRRGAGAERHAAGEERHVVAMFVDMRGSTRLAETRLPYDTVFVINRFLEAVGRGVVVAGGTPNQFLGDGMMALFGIGVPPEAASRQALEALGLIAANVGVLNVHLDSHLEEPIRFGIGLHAGTAILGEVGDQDAGRAVFTAIGDPVNVASRLQGLTKAFGVEAVVSEAVFEAAGIASGLPDEEIAVEGRSGRLRVRLLAQASDALRPGEPALP